MSNKSVNISLEDKIALRINEAVAVSGLSRSTLYKLLDAKKLRHVKVGGRRLILIQDLHSLLNGSST
ncbi:helix-turn-helix domain-containing protein [Methylocella silvestris]|uniref:helix-turn-helix domain-containing protein n=1 Tax=Methylocella silvestris TaxID=199596 RepID=UPI0009FCB821